MPGHGTHFHFAYQFNCSTLWSLVTNVYVKASNHKLCTLCGVEMTYLNNIFLDFLRNFRHTEYYDSFLHMSAIKRVKKKIDARLCHSFRSIYIILHALKSRRPDYNYMELWCQKLTVSNKVLPTHKLCSGWCCCCWTFQNENGWKWKLYKWATWSCWLPIVCQRLEPIAIICYPINYPSFIASNFYC